MRIGTTYCKVISDKADFVVFITKKSYVTKNNTLKYSRD